MPKFLKEKLEREYPDNPGAVFGTMNVLGAVHGNKETAKGRAMQEKHDAETSPKVAKVKRLKDAAKALKA